MTSHKILFVDPESPSHVTRSRKASGYRQHIRGGRKMALLPPAGLQYVFEFTDKKLSDSKGRSQKEKYPS